MLNPIQLRMAANGGGDSATLMLSSDIDVSAYFPSVVYVADPQNPLVVLGIYEVVPQEGRVTTVKAKFMFPYTMLIPALESADSRCIVGGIDFMVMVARRRRYRGVVSGYSLELQVG